MRMDVAPRRSSDPSPCPTSATTHSTSREKSSCDCGRAVSKRPASKARRADRAIDLTAKEYALLEFFLRNKQRVLSRTIIAEHIWDYHFDTGTNLIDVYINHLRNKVDTGFEKKLIHTVRGVGYVMKEE